MPSFKIGMVINSVIAAKFPGGLIGWAMACCDVVAIPCPFGKDVVYILLPEESTRGMELESFRDDLEQMSKQFSFDLHWMSKGNFEGMEMAKVKKAAEEVISNFPMPSVAVLVRPACILMYVKEATEEEAETLLSAFEGIEGAHRACLVTPTLFRDKVYSTSSMQPASEPERSRAVSHDDVADVASLVEGASSIDEFIERM